MNGYHAGIGYTQEQCDELDELFRAWMSEDVNAAASNYENTLVAASAEALYQEYAEKVQEFDEWRRGVVDHDVALQYEDVMVDAR